MSDYSLQVTWSTKDALPANSQLKAVSATELGNEFSAIATAVATKYDSDDIASTVEAQNLTVNNKLITPSGLNDVLTENAGILSDLQALADPAAHVLFGWDNTNNAAEAFINATNGGIAIGENTVAVDLNDLGTETTIASGDFIPMVDITDSGSEKITLANLITSINSLGTIDHDAATNFVADEHVAHSSISITAGTGLSGGGTIDGNVTLTVDLSELTAFSADQVDIDTDYFIMLDGGASGADRKAPIASLLSPEVVTDSTGGRSLTDADHGKVLIYSGTGTDTITLPNGLRDGFWITIVKTGASGTLTLSAATTLNTENSATQFAGQYGAVTCFHAGSNVWYAWGSLV